MRLKLEERHIETVVSVILRVPGIFVIEYWWQHERTELLPVGWDDAAASLLSSIVLVQGLLFLTLQLERLVNLYMYYISAGLLVFGHLFSQHYIQVEQQWQSKSPLGLAGYLQNIERRSGGGFWSIDSVESSSLDQDFLKRQFAAILTHICVAACIAFLLDLQHNIQTMMLAAYSLPVVARLSGFCAAHDDLRAVHNFASAFIILQAMYYVVKCLPTTATSWKYLRYVGANGLLPRAVVNSVFVPAHFFLFWTVQLLAHLYYYVHVRSWAVDEWHLLLLRCISDVCSSPVSLMATAVALSYVSYLTLAATKFYLQGYRAFVNDNVMHSGWTEGLTMALIGAQTGLIEMRMPYRAAVMSITLFIVFSSLIQSMFEITEPILLSLSASQNPGFAKHFRTLLLCAFLFAFPLYMTHLLCTIFPVDFWMLVVVSSCIMTSIQVMGLVAVYLLFIYDAVCRRSSWDGLDDVVYYVRAVMHVLEFAVAVVVVGAGLKESVAGHWSWINSAVLVVHCYFNVWQRLQSGWKIFLMRRDAVLRIESLSVATEEELERYGDVCAICYGEMKSSARVTSCRHLYHTNCIRKWLYVQPKCPICHAPILAAAQTTPH